MPRRQLIALAALLACMPMTKSAETAPGDAAWALSLPAREKVVFHGQVNFDKAGQGPGTMLYPVPGLAGFVVALATHALVVNGLRQEERSEIESAADRILLPFRKTLATFNHGELAERAFPVEAGVRLLDGDARTPAGMRIASAPVFYMTQDQSALIVDNTVSVFQAGSKRPVYTNTVRVVSRAVEVENEAIYWQRNRGQRLREASAALFRESVEIARADALAPMATLAGAQQTFRYLEGKTEAIERAEPISEFCGRALVRNLRGWLMSVPVKRASPAPGCDAAGLQAQQ
ncbi:hypothetical protein [Pseudoduganella violaceinigra]|uniref:hypothetical protein n=1 Tax=Pseudoduganella violaceinigra TaxID=246602 RepID=UPI00041EFC07|nr:hypothetical protein [Pseudoduganella violaceinigra]